MSQREVILDQLKRGRVMTSMKAFRFGITRLSSIILRLRREGYEISTKIIKKKSDKWQKVEYAEYRLKK